MTDEQLAIVKTFVQSGQDAAITAAGAARNDTLTAQLLNAPSTFYIWRWDVSPDELLGCIKLAYYTPADMPDDTLLYANRCHVCELKQNSLRLLLQRNYLTTQKLSTRQDLSDALTLIPAGVDGAALDAGWLGTNKVKDTINRPASVVEKLFATGNGTSGQPGDAAWLGTINVDDIGRMWNA